MRRMLTFLVLAFCLAGPAQAGDTVSAADRDAIQHVITSQMAAFARNDAVAAFGFAAPHIRMRFGDAQHFLQGVRDGYPAVFRPRSFRFGALAPEKRLLIQHVELVGPDGEPALALYSMEHEPDGNWRIAGCSLVTDPRVEI